MARQLSEKLHTVVDKELKAKVLEAARLEERSEGFIIRRALRVYFNMNGDRKETP
jgi:hypothetical protein